MRIYVITSIQRRQFSQRKSDRILRHAASILEKPYRNEKEIKNQKIPDMGRERTSSPNLGEITEAIQLLLESRPCVVCRSVSVGDRQGCI